MRDQGEGGQIVNTASAAAFAPNRTLPAYSSTKAAVLMLSECLRAELEPWGIGVTAVCPGFVATNITRTTRWVGRSEDELGTTSSEHRLHFGPILTDLCGQPRRITDHQN